MSATRDFSPMQPRVAGPTLVGSSFISILTDELSYSDWKLVRVLSPLADTPGLISLLAGMPNPETFPFTSLSFTAKSPLENDQDVTLTLDQEDLVEGLQYSAAAGLPRLLDWLKGLQERQHGRRKGEGWDITVGTGSQDLIYKVNLFPISISTTVNVHAGHYGDGESRRLCAS